MDDNQYRFLKQIEKRGSYTDDYYNRSEIFASSVRQKYLSNEFSDDSNLYTLTTSGKSAMQEYREKHFQLKFTTITSIIALILSLISIGVSIYSILLQ